jgi:D-arabinose 1-dehydrogenase-like Zn-dependent alcohol dehydrogenase
VATTTAARLDTQLNALRLDTVQIPDPSADEVRIKVAHARICLTDIHFISGETAAGMPATVTLGHEVSGVVDSLGSNVFGVSVGDRGCGSSSGTNGHHDPDIGCPLQRRMGGVSRRATQCSGLDES